MIDIPPIGPGGIRGAGYVYFMLAAEGLPRPLVKIGFSRRSPPTRLKDCQTGSPVKLSLLGLMVGVTMTAERDLHKRFKHLRSHGEWFFFEDDLRAFVEELTQ